jgi:hypothetical protein
MEFPLLQFEPSKLVLTKELKETAKLYLIDNIGFRKKYQVLLKDLEAEYEAKKAKIERNFQDVCRVVEQYSHEEIYSEVAHLAPSQVPRFAEPKTSFGEQKPNFGFTSHQPQELPSFGLANFENKIKH